MTMSSDSVSSGFKQNNMSTGRQLIDGNKYSSQMENIACLHRYIFIKFEVEWQIGKLLLT